MKTINIFALLIHLNNANITNHLMDVYASITIYNAQIIEQLQRPKMKNPRKISKIAEEIAKDWRNIRWSAEPYLQIMFVIESINDIYGSTNGKNIILRFLCNAATWRGETAKRIKKELKEMVK
jgi:hypothetical protein